MTATPNLVHWSVSFRILLGLNLAIPLNYTRPKIYKKNWPETIKNISNYPEVFFDTIFPEYTGYVATL